MASAMADSVQNAVRSSEMTPLDLTLAVQQFVVQLETEVYPKEFFRQVAESSDESIAPPRRNEARAVLENYDSTDNLVPLHAAIVRLSDKVYVASLCGEVCYEVKQAVQRAFGDRKLIFIGYCDGIAYVPGDRMIQEGGYEVDGSVVEFCLKGRFKPGVNKKVSDAYRENLEHL